MTIQTSWDSTTILGSSQETPSRLGDWILKSNKHNLGRQGRGWCAHAWIGWLTQRGATIFSQEQGLKVWILGRERERSSRLDLRERFFFFWVANGLGGRWASIYSPHSIIAVGGMIHRTCPVGHQTSPVEPSRVQWGQICLVHRSL
jgi:hypothetical protein